MITARVGSITTPSTQAVVNAANGIGILGAGTAGALLREGGQCIQDEAKKKVQENGANFKPGECYVTSAGALRERGVRSIYHAVTMEYPGSPGSYDGVNKAINSVLLTATQDGMESIAVPGLGTGIGGLDKVIVASIVVQKAKYYNAYIDVVFLDISAEFINAVNKLLR